MFGWVRRLLERVDPDVWGEDRAAAMAFKLPPVASIPLPPVDPELPKFGYPITRPLMPKEYAALKRSVARAVADINKTPLLPNTSHRPPRSGADIDRKGAAARPPKPRKRKTAAKKKHGARR